MVPSKYPNFDPMAMGLTTKLYQKLLVEHPFPLLQLLNSPLFLAESSRLTARWVQKIIPDSAQSQGTENVCDFDYSHGNHKKELENCLVG